MEKVNIIKDGTVVVTENDVKPDVFNYIIPASVKMIKPDVFKLNSKGYNEVLYTGTRDQFKKIVYDRESNCISCVYCTDGFLILHI